MDINQFNLLKTRRFLPLFTTQFLGAFNDNIFKNALVILITYRLTELTKFNAQILVTLAAGVFILPFFLFSATAGQLADKYEKSRLIAIIKFIEILLMGLATTGFYLQSVPLLISVLFGLGAHATFFGPLKYAILPDHLQENELIAGNSLIEAGTFISILLGTILGGTLILYSQGETLISTMVLVIATGGWISSCFIPKSRSYNPYLKVNYNFLKETQQLIQYSKNRWDIFLAILGISWFWLMGATFLSEFPALAKDVLHANENVATLFIALFSIGLAIGSLFCNKLLQGKIHATYVPLGALGMTLFTIDLYLAANNARPLLTSDFSTVSHFLLTVNNWRIVIDLLCISICGGLYTVPLYAILQHRSEAAHRARVIASNNIMNAAFMVIAATTTMLMLKLGFSVKHVFLVLAIGNGVVALFICKLLPQVLLRGFFHWILKFFYGVKVKGLENYQQAGSRVVIIANHVSFIDAILLATFLPDQLKFAVNTISARKWWVRIFLRVVDVYPIDPTNPMAIKSLINYVQQNHRCVIFPEGRLTVTGALMKIYEGPGLVADKSKAKLLPIRIDGAEYTRFSRLKGKVRIRWMPKITITIFPPQNMDVPAEIKGRKRRQIAGQKLYNLMTEMMFESSDYNQTLFDSLIDAKTTHGGGHKVIEDIEREPISYQQFITRSFILGSMITKSAQAGEHVGILLPNTISGAITFFAMLAYGRIPAMLNYSTGIKNIVIACQTAQIKTVYSARKFVQMAKFTELATAINKAGIHIVYLEDLRASVTILDKLKGKLMAQCPRLAYQYITSPTQPDADATAVILFTSGSEGTPKGVVLSHRNLQANRYQLGACLDFTASDNVFNALPIFHSFGLMGGMIMPLLTGVRIFLYPSPLHYRIIPELAYDTNATIFFATDTFLANYAKYAHPYDFYSIRYVFAGAEKLRDETRVLWSQKFGIRIFEAYGTTETSPGLTVNTPMQNKIGTVGRMLPGIQYRLTPVPGISNGGILSVSGPNVMKGYLLADQPGILIPLKDGWYETGDVVAIDENGFVTIKDRVKRFAKIAGEMVSLTMVEQQINKLWPEYQHAVINIPDARKGEQLVLVTTYQQATREAMVSYAKVNLSGEIAIPKKILFLKQMLLLGSGKIDYPAVKEFVSDALAESLMPA